MDQKPKKDQSQSNNQKKNQQKKKEQKSLSPKEEADLQRKRKIFKDLHDVFAGDTIFEAEGGVSEMMGLIMGMFQKYQEIILIKDMGLEDEITDKKKYLLEVLGDCSVSEAYTYCDALRNAIDQHKYIKLKETTVTDLAIKLL